MRSTRRVLDQAEAELRSAPELAKLFDWFTDATRTAGEPRRERLAAWFAASRLAVVVLVVGPSPSLQRWPFWCLCPVRAAAAPTIQVVHAPLRRC